MVDLLIIRRFFNANVKDGLTYHCHPRATCRSDRTAAIGESNNEKSECYCEGPVWRFLAAAMSGLRFAAGPGSWWRNTAARDPLSPMLSLLIVGLGLFSQPLLADAALRYASIDIDEVGHVLLERIKAQPGLDWWVELDRELLVLAPESRLGELALGRPFVEHDVVVLVHRLFFLRKAHERLLDPADWHVLSRGGRFAVVQARSSRRFAGEVLAHDGVQSGAQASFELHAVLQTFEPNTVLAHQAANDPPRLARGFPAGTQYLVDQVDGERWFADLSTLAGWDRYTHGAEIDDARDWLVQQFTEIGGLDVSTHSFMVSGTPAFNVVATLIGNSDPDRTYIVGAHYDSISEAPNIIAAPGAEDNASGCAAVVEMARILVPAQLDATVHFICYSGEEQGLFGSDDHAQMLVDAGVDAEMHGAMIMDMIGYTIDADLDCLLETTDPVDLPAVSPLFDTLRDAAAQYTTLRIVTSFNPFGSDHIPYLDRQMPAVLAIENDWDEYPHYHQSTDLPANITIEMGVEIVRMGVGAIANIAGANIEGVFMDGFETGDESRWQ